MKTAAILRRQHWISGIGVLLTVAVLISGISGCGRSIPPVETTQPVVFAAGESATVVSEVVGSSGGTIEAGYSGTPIDGITVEFPAGAFTGDANVSLGYNTGTLTPNEGDYAGFALVLDTGDTTRFEEPIIVTVPFDDAEATPVPYYIDSEGRLHPTQLLEIDRTAGVFKFGTFHASFFAWIKSLFASPVYAPSDDDIVETAYHPGNDGFQVRNRGNEYTGNGECLGMTSFSLWYYRDHKSTKGDFYYRFMNVVGTDSDGNTLRGQDIVATRAHISVAQQWGSYYWPIVAQQRVLSDEDRWVNITNAIVNTGRPVILYLSLDLPVVKSQIPHAVLAYACNLLGHISIYDPNYPGQSRGITYDRSLKSFVPYGLWNEIMLCADGTFFHLTEPYESILDDAEADFQYSEGATITITSHADGQEVDERDITLTGSIQSGQVLVTRFSVFVGSTQFLTEVDHDGHFGLPLNLETGTNHLQFLTEGYDKSGRLVPVGNNMITRDFTIITSLEEEDPIDLECIPMVAAGGWSTGGLTVGLKSDGTVVAVGANLDGACDVGEWNGIVQVAAGGGAWDNHTLGLKSDGTVVATGSDSYEQCDVDEWTDIVQIDGGAYHTLGLKSDGTVVAVGRNNYGQCDVGGWTDIVQVAAGGLHTVGLKPDGTVVAVGHTGHGRLEVGDWTEIVQVDAGYSHTVGLKSDGTVVAVGRNDSGQCNVGGWMDIVQVTAGSKHTVGLNPDGTVVAVGSNFDKQRNVGGWTDIIQVAAGSHHTVGLRSDGTVVAVGLNLSGQCNVGGWMLIV